MIADLEAGIGTALRLRPAQVDVVIAVVEPTVKSLEVGEQVCSIASRREARVIVIANQVKSKADVEMIADRLQPEELFVIPYDPAVAEADRKGVAPLDVDSSSPAVTALAELAAVLAQPRAA